MKSLQEIREILTDELPFFLQAIEEDAGLIDDNDYVRDFASSLSCLLHLHLKNGYSEWKGDRWVDDCLLMKADHHNNRLKIWGVVISGIGHTTAQWTDPLYAVIELNRELNIGRYSLSFGDQGYESVNYEDFANNRGCWDRDYYSDNRWDPAEREWVYTVTEYL